MGRSMRKVCVNFAVNRDADMGDQEFQHLISHAIERLKTRYPTAQNFISEFLVDANILDGKRLRIVGDVLS